MFSPMTKKRAPTLWSDFDGTAVKKYGSRNPLNWTKYPLPALPGYLDFMRGVQHTGVALGGVVTIRKEFFRRHLTELSIRKLGYGGIILPSSVEYAGSEKGKGRFVAEQSRKGVVGMIDDKPHWVGKVILEALVEGNTYNPIILGAVGHAHTEHYMERLCDVARSLELLVHETNSGEPETPGLGFTASNGQQTLQVVQIGAYSVEAGQAFGNLLQAAS